ncbi:alpha/beta hydrolase family esterase [Sorangium sp. So ce887]|uniref:alpha/beta hydrolase family esterase n=1 Tax=Sorangium sp. So ce887 TaxID=3133324 RepID=UPI003F62EA9C
MTRPDPRQQQTLTVGGVTRYYLIHVPENYDPSKPLPLVFGIHGLNMNNVWAAHDNSGFQLIQETKNQALLIYPQGLPADGQSRPPSTQSQWGTADSNWGGPPPSANPARLEADLAFFDAMLEHAKASYCVDTKRVFAVGFSQGGFMTNTLGCQRSSVFHGLAPVAGWGPNGSQPTCSDAGAAHPLIQTQGDTDGTVTPALGQSTRDFWRGRNGCQATTMPSADFGDGCVEYQGCKEGLPLVYCTHPGGHSVPSGAGGRAWRFFQSLE